MQGALPGFRAARGQSPHVHPAPRKRNSPVGAESLPGACWPEDQEALLSAISASSTPAVAARFRMFSCFQGPSQVFLFQYVSIFCSSHILASQAPWRPDCSVAQIVLAWGGFGWAALTAESLKVCFFPSTPTACTPTLRSPSRQAWEDRGKPWKTSRAFLLGRCVSVCANMCK